MKAAARLQFTQALVIITMIKLLVLFLLIYVGLANAVEYLPGIENQVSLVGKAGNYEYKVSATLASKDYRLTGRRGLGSLSVVFDGVALKIDPKEYKNLDIVSINEIGVAFEGSWQGTPTIYLHIPYSDYVSLDEIEKHDFKDCVDEEGYKMFNEKYKVLAFDLKGNLKASSLKETCNH